MTTQNNNRKHLRKQMHSSTRVSVDGKPSFYTGFIKNISEGGLFIHTYNILPIGTKMHVTFKVPKTDHIVELPAEVMWQRPSDSAADPEEVGYGVRFTSLPPEVKSRIDDYIAKKETIFYLD